MDILEKAALGISGLTLDEMAADYAEDEPTSILAQVKREYFITETTPVGRIDWAINDFLKNNNLAGDDFTTLVMATAQEIKEAK